MIVREPDNGDWENLFHLMKYIRVTRNLQLILSANRSGILNVGLMDHSQCIQTLEGTLVVVYQ